MLKYHNKLNNFLQQYIDKYNLVNHDKHSNKLALEIINNSVKYAFENKYNIKLLKTQKIKKLHSDKEPPLMFLYLREQKIYNNDFKNFIKWYNTHIHNLTIIKNLYSKIGKIIFEPIEERKLLHSIYDNNFVCIDIHQEIETNDIIHEKYSINDTDNIDLFFFDSSEKPNIKVIATIITIIKTLSQKNYNVNLIIIFSSHKKIIKKNTEILCCNHINSGSTYPTQIITCFRKEEFYKVLMHELIHYYELDFHFSSKSYVKLETMLKIPSIKGIDRLNESYTESLTIIIMSYFTHYYTNFSKSFEYYLNKEIIFSLFQIAKILKLFGATKFEDYLDNKIIIKQHTSVRSYFFIKTFLLLNLNLFFDFLNVSFFVTDDRLIEFGTLINTSYEKISEYSSIINYFINIINTQYDDTCDTDTWIYKTSRLSSF